MANVLITGANRGIGLALAQHYVKGGHSVIGCVRDPEAAKDLKALSGVSVEQMDVGDPASITAAAGRIGAQPIDILINNAGATGGGAQSLDNLDLDAWHEALNVNTIGPLLVARDFKNNLAASGNGKLMTLTSQLAASTWPMGGMYIYGSTKAGLSRAFVSLSIDWKDEPISVGLMHPGWVQTDMGGPQAEITPDESAAGIIKVIDEMTKADSGNFYKWNGEKHPF